jgi:CRISPR-associated protein Cas2
VSRRRLLVTYDVCDDRRRNQVFRLLSDQGDHVQFSVFLCELSDRERVRLLDQLERLLNAAEDQVLFLDMGSAEHDPTLTMTGIGRPFVPPVRTLVV